MFCRSNLGIPNPVVRFSETVQTGPEVVEPRVKWILSLFLGGKAARV
jgi:hypothetical protein